MPSYSVSRETETRVRAEITVSADEWKVVEENVLRRIAAEAELKGFRRGKAPLHLVRREFAGELQLDTLLEIAGQSIDAIESKIEHTIYKIVSITNFQDKGNKRSFTTIADLQPYVRLPKLKVAQVRPVVPAISDDDLADAIHRELLPYAHYKEVPPEVGAEKYDRMVADVEFWIDDVPQGDPLSDVTIDLGLGKFHEWIEKEIIAERVKAGSEFRWRKEENRDGKKEIREYIFSVKKLERPELPELTDSFVAEKFSVPTTAQWREQVREQLANTMQQISRRWEIRKALVVLEQNSQFFIPESFTDSLAAEFLKQKKISSEELSAEQLQRLRQELNNREKPALLMRQLIRDAQANYQKRRKTTETFRDLFKKFVREKLSNNRNLTEQEIGALDKNIDAMLDGQESPLKPVLNMLYDDFFYDFLFDYFDAEGIVKKGEKMSYTHFREHYLQKG
ncbi:MAG: trigger factor [Turneriella sp.]|nr:trigger factor [Turneriella sp.]